MSAKDVEESPNLTRKSLKMIQHNSAFDRENLVGRPTKRQLSSDSPVDLEVKRKNVSSKESQASFDTNITEDCLTNPNGASEKYWEILAEKRRKALQDALDENEKLHKIIKDVKEENGKLRQMLEEANNFIEVVKEEMKNTSCNDTGIDVNDVSTADEINDVSIREETQENEAQEPNSTQDD